MSFCQEVDIATYVTEYVGDRPDNTIFKNASGQYFVNGTYSDEEYRTKAIVDDEKEFEKMRRANNLDYRAAIDGYNRHTLKRPGRAAAYVTHSLQTIKAHMEELMSPERHRRRFLRFRQRQYTYGDIAKRIVFGDVQ